MQALLERLAIAEVVQAWALARDIGDWEALRKTTQPGATLTTTWFHGGIDEFIEACQASWRRGSRAMHILGGTAVELNGGRALARTRVTILVRGQLEGVAVDVACHGRLHDRVEKRDGLWRIARRAVVYERDRIDPVEPGAPLKLEPALLLRFPEGYRHLAYLQAKAGAEVNPNLPTAQGEALQKLLVDEQDWLRG